MAPPPVPPGHVYTRCYCEENIYTLAAALTRTPPGDGAWDAYAVFISNHQKTVALWHQQARAGAVLWDYHVVLVLRARPRGAGETPTAPAACWVYDFDSRAGVPCPWQGAQRPDLLFSPAPARVRRGGGAASRTVDGSVR